MFPDAQEEQRLLAEYRAEDEAATAAALTSPAPPPRAVERDNRRVAYRVLKAADQHWRRSNQMSTLNTDLAKQLEAGALGARLWRIEPGQASTRHRHREQEELYVLLEGTGRARIGEEVLTLEPMDTMLVEPATVRQLFNDTDADQLWLVVGAPAESGNTLEMSEETLREPLPGRAESAASRARRLSRRAEPAGPAR